VIGETRTQSVPMRDGATLAADVYLPGERPAPALLVRTPYGRRRFESVVFGHPSRYVERGYAVVCQDVRGRGDSDGQFRPFAQEAADGHDSVEWIAGQQWCDGRVGMYGFSYPGFAQLAAAGLRPPHLRAIAPAMTAADVREEWLYESGILRLAFVIWWSSELGKGAAARAGDEDAFYELARVQRNLCEACWDYTRRRSLPPALERVSPFVAEWISRRDDPAYWAEREAPEGAAKLPGLYIAGWYDTFLEGTIAAFRRASVEAAGRQYLLVGPWQHVPWGPRVGDVDFGPTAVSRVDAWVLQFFDATLRGRSASLGALDRAPVLVFLSGAGTWLPLSAWPPPEVVTRSFYLAGGPAFSSNGDGMLALEPGHAEAVERYAVDPWDPAQAVGGWSCCDPARTPMGPRDYAAEQQRNDRLVFDSAPLREPLAAVGQPRVALDFSSDVATTDLVVRLCDVDRQGAAYAVSERAVRLGAFGDHEQLRLDLSPLAVSFEPGHRIRLELTGASFPARELNLQAAEGEAAGSLVGARVATHVLHHGGGHPSRLELPVYPDATRPTTAET
jgi:putative CocE/NonD family hydrolase